MKKLKDVLAHAAHPEISLTKLVSEPILDIVGTIDNSMGIPFFRVSEIRFADGRTISIDALNAGDGSGPIAILDESGRSNVIQAGQLEALDEEIQERQYTNE